MQATIRMVICHLSIDVNIAQQGAQYGPRGHRSAPQFKR